VEQGFWSPDQWQRVNEESDEERFTGKGSLEETFPSKQAHMQVEPSLADAWQHTESHLLSRETLKWHGAMQKASIRRSLER
jgi:hypothetical protein